MDDGTPLASLSLTHVHYNPADRISYVCAWLALVPQGLCVVYATLLWSSREAEIGLMFAGQLACEALNWLLKRYIKEERPRQMNGKGYGMPSSHAQFVAFFAVSLALFLLLRHNPPPHHQPASTSASTPSDHTPPQPNDNDHDVPWAAPLYQHAHTPLTLPLRAALSLAGLAAAALVALSRIYLNYHTPRQVLVGFGTGVAFACVWFAATAWARRAGWVEWGLDTWPARALRLRDLVVEEDLVEAGWVRWEGRRRERRARKGR
ncbi:PAP2 superfamily-domain-containing protein [Lineolata rhizophorae]|uniref:Dolichyldiphosphatase n=1 Tax=Lineolata rhizophorae TaxID=578093 RepID=A0A6A6PEC5_9PEZI|nr:PAP2 superfamily-domain-containing protein [Lineolata rhizophorae]